MATPAHLPSYAKPPVVEVVCGILFEPLDILQMHFGLLWQKYQPDYPGNSEVAALAPMIESFDSELGAPSFEITDVPPLRTWFIHRNETGIVQVQRDRFLHNWKKVRPDDAYPRYSSVIELFRERLATFEEFLAEMSLGQLRPKQYELTYVNQIPQGDAWITMADIGAVFPDFLSRNTSQRFLPAPELFNWRTTYVLPNKHGRLHVTMRRAVRGPSKEPILHMELTARGFPGGDSDREAMWRWFELGHDWIVRAFADLTSETLQENLWRKVK